MSSCRSFCKAATATGSGVTLPPVAAPKHKPGGKAPPQRAGRRQHPPGHLGSDGTPPPSSTAAQELNKLLSLLKALLSEPPHVLERALGLLAKEQLLPTALAWVDRALPITLVEVAAGTAQGGGGGAALAAQQQAAAQAALTGLHRLLRLLAVMLQRLYAAPEDLHGGGGAALASVPLDLQPLARLLARTLHPMLAAPYDGGPFQQQQHGGGDQVRAARGGACGGPRAAGLSVTRAGCVPLGLRRNTPLQ